MAARSLAGELIRNEATRALLEVLNDIGGGNPWNYNVMTEAAEDALDAALATIVRGARDGDPWVDVHDLQARVGARVLEVVAE